MKTVIGVCLVSLMTFYAYQGAPTPDIRPLDLGPIESPAELKVLNPSEILLVNMIPREQGDEHDQNSEPFLAVQGDEGLMIGAFQEKFRSDTGVAPLILISSDKGLTWQPRSLLPGTLIGAQTYCFSGKGTSLYGAVMTIAGAQRAVSVFHTANPATEPLQNISTLTSGPQYGDAPFIQAGTSGQAPAEGEIDNRVDRVFVGQNFFGFPPAQQSRTASIRVRVDGRPFTLFGLEARDTVGQDAPPVRPAIANDETVYVAFIRWSAKEGNLFRGDVIVTRDDNSARAENSFRALVDPTDMKPGRIVEKGRQFSFYEKLGKQRVISPLSLAVDPVHSEIVFVAWGDYDVATKTHNLHLRRSSDKGQNWSEDLRKIPSATNPAIAVSEKGVVGLLYQQLLPKTLEEQERWETHFLSSDDGGRVWTDIPLTSIPTLTSIPRLNQPESESDPDLGYRTHLLANKTNFYGVFSAPNQPNPRYFPQGVSFQRNYHNGNLVSNNGEIIASSIDPYFFRITGASPPPITLAVGQADLLPPGRFTAFIVKFGLPVAILSLLFLAAVATLQLFRARKVSRAIDQRIHGSTLTNYKGFVTARLMDADGNLIERSDPGSQCRLIVRFSYEAPADELFEEIDLHGGEDAREVPFVIAIDSVGFEVVPDHQSVGVPAKGSMEAYFKVIATPGPEGQSLFVQIYQKTRLVQVVAPVIGRAKLESY
jgi:hypothetical protein